MKANVRNCLDDFSPEGKEISLGLEKSQWSEFQKRADQVDLSTSKLLIIKMQAASTCVR